MCRDCGCQEANQNAHGHLTAGKWVRRSHPPSPRTNPRRISIEQSVLAKNDHIAKENRNWFSEHQIPVLNLISSPGAGKTLLLEKTIAHLGAEFKIAILTGDQERDFDAQRLKAVGAEVLQLNTLSSCHLDAAMIRKEIGAFVRPDHQLLIIENVGNLVCPAAFDLGENEKIAILSCTEGEDKPAKYPLLFHEASLVILSKMDLQPHLDWNLELCESYIRKVNANVPIIKLSSRSEDGFAPWLDFVRSRIRIGAQLEALLAP